MDFIENIIKKIKSSNKKTNYQQAEKLQEKDSFDKIFNRELDKYRENNYPTKKEYEESIIKINEEELNSERFKKIKQFMLEYYQRDNIELEKKLFKIIGTYGLEDDLINKDYETIINSRFKRYNKLKKFMNSLTKEQIDSNIYLKNVKLLMEISLHDCKLIVKELVEKISDLEVSDKNQRLEVNTQIPQETLNVLPLMIKEQVSVLYYNPNVYKKKYVYLLDSDNQYIYADYNKYVRNINKIATDIYHLQMINLLSVYPEQIDNYYFSILNNEFEHEFRTAYFVKKNNDKKENIELENQKFGNSNPIFNYYFSILNNKFEHEFRTAYFVKKNNDKKENIELENQKFENSNPILCTSIEEIIDKILENPRDFYIKIANELSIEEREYIKTLIENKCCSNCANETCNVETCDKIYSESCIAWDNKELIGRKKVLIKK